MKRLLSVAMILAMLLGIASVTACEKKEETPAPSETIPAETTPAEPAPAEPAEGEITKEMLENSKPNEYLKEKLAAGMDVLVAFSSITDNFFTQALSGGVAAELEPLGYTVDYLVGENNVTTQLNQIDNCVSMGYSLIIIIAPDPNVVQTTIEAAQNSGVSVLLYGEKADYTCVVRLDCYESAWQQSAMADAWIQKVYPGEKKIVAVLATSANSANLEKQQSYLDYVEQSPNMELGYFHEQCTDIELGFTAAEEAMTVFPETRVFLDFDIGASNGVNNYLISQIPAGLNIDEFGIFAAGEDNNTRAMLAADYAEPTAFRGTILDGETMWDAVVECAMGILDGEISAPYEFMQPIFAVTNYGYEYDTRLL